MKEPTYRQAISHSWEIAKKHKLLWLFGFFATFLGQMGMLDFLVNAIIAADQGMIAPYSALFNIPAITATVFAGLQTMGLGLSGWAWIGWLAVFFVGVGLLLTFVSVTSQAALIHGVTQTMKRTRKKYIDVDKAWHAGTGHFWRLFFLHVIKRALIVLMAFIVGFAAYNVALNASSLDAVLFYALLCGALGIGMVLSFLVVYTAGYIVIEEYRLFDAIVAAWNLFTKHMLVSVEVGLIVVLANLIAGIAAMGALAAFMGHMAVFWALTLILGSSTVWLFGVVIGVSVFLLALVTIGTILTVFTTTTWTYLFMKMHKKGVKSRITHHVFSFARSK